MKKEFVEGCPVWATIYDGHAHIERRVYIDERGKRYVKICGCYFTCDCLMKRNEVAIWF